jgi:hypothetical protein
VFALLAPAPAVAQSEGPNAEIRAVSAIAPLRTDSGDRARNVYRALIPEPLTMPAEPAVGVWLADLAYGAGRGRPADDASHWLEGAVQIRVRFGELEGWYPIHYPVTAEFWWSAGRSAGLPKRRATAAIVPDGKAGPGRRTRAAPPATRATASTGSPRTASTRPRRCARSASPPTPCSC